MTAVETVDAREVVTTALYDVAAEWQLPQPQVTFQGSVAFVTATQPGDVSIWAAALGLSADGAMVQGVWQGWRVAVSAS